MYINYNGEATFLGELDIDNIGEFAIEANNDEGMFWYYICRTLLGTTTIATSGPKIPDVDLLPKTFHQSRYTMQFNEGKIVKDVTKFLNDWTKRITNAKLIPIDEAVNQFVNLRDYLEDYGEDIY